MGGRLMPGRPIAFRAGGAEDGAVVALLLCDGRAILPGSSVGLMDSDGLGTSYYGVLLKKGVNSTPPHSYLSQRERR